MTRRLVVGERELEAVTKIPAAARYDYFVKRVADWQSAWALWKDDGWVLMGNADGEQLFPLWPALEFAAQCAAPMGWEGAEPEPIELTRLLEELLPKLEEGGIKVAVFPAVTGESRTGEANRIATDLRCELENY